VLNNLQESEKIVFHVVTDSLNLPAISMWFLLNPPGKATIQIQSIDDFEWLSTKYNTTLKKQSSSDTRYRSELNYLRFYLPDVYPALDKIVLLDHDVVVQRDLTELWSVNMKGKVNGAVETCHDSEALLRRMDMLINFSDPIVAKSFDVNACTWAFGMNLFDLREWRQQYLTSVYHKYLQLVSVFTFVLAFACLYLLDFRSICCPEEVHLPVLSSLKI
jgi:alpha-1,4-galacturonosyltransferase